MTVQDTIWDLVKQGYKRGRIEIDETSIEIRYEKDDKFQIVRFWLQ